MMFAELLKPELLISLTEMSTMVVVAVLLTHCLNTNFKLAGGDLLAVFWLLFDCMVHIIIALPFVVVSLTGTVQDSDHWSILPWKETGKVDSRVLVSDPAFISIELLAILLVSLLCALIVYTICRPVTFVRHFAQIVYGVCELYGLLIKFLPEMLTGFPSLSTDNMMNLVLYIGFNLIWMFAPLALLHQSYTVLQKEIGGTSVEKKSYSLRTRSTKKAQ